MTTRRDDYEASVRRHKPTVREQTADLPMFAAPSAFEQERDLERLATLAGELALKAGRHGVTVGDLRITAVNRGLLTGEEDGKRLAGLLSQVMRKAGLYATTSYRRSAIEKSHANLHVVWVTDEWRHIA